MNSIAHNVAELQLDSPRSMLEAQCSILFVQVLGTNKQTHLIKRFSIMKKRENKMFITRKRRLPIEERPKVAI